jgi:hypothetical protein
MPEPTVGVGDLDAGVLDRLHRSGDAVVDEDIHPARFLRRHVDADIEATHLAGDLAAEGGGIELGDAVDAGTPGDQPVPGGLQVIAERAHHAEPGHHHTAFCGHCARGIKAQRDRRLATIGGPAQAFFRCAPT